MKLTVISGPPGCGKTTVATEMLKKDPKLVRINRDDLRAMIHRDLKWSKQREEIIAFHERAAVIDALGNGCNVVLDNTHLKASTIDFWRDFVADSDHEFEHINWGAKVSLAECIRRDALRTGAARVGRGVIDRMALQNKLIDLSGLDKVAIVDVDGTKGALDWRLPFLDETPKNYDAFFAHVEQDGVYETIWAAVHKLKQTGHTIVILSGRPNSVGHATNEWINGRAYMTEGVFEGTAFKGQPLGYNPDWLFMRQAGDHRPDFTVKEQIYNWMLDCGLKKDAVKIVLDDREVVCQLWRKHDLPLVKVLHGCAEELHPNALQLAIECQIPINGC